MPERSSFCDRRVVIDPQEKPSEETPGDRRTVIDKPSPALEFLDDSDSHLESHKVSWIYTKCGVFSSLDVYVFGLSSSIPSVTH